MSALKPAAVACVAALLLVPFGLAHAKAAFTAGPAIPSVPAISEAAPVFQRVQDDSEVGQAKAKKLAGSVHMALAGSPLALVLVEECDPTFTKVLASTHTDHYGNFSLKPGRRGKIHYLRLSAKGFETKEYEVTLDPAAGDTLQLELQLRSTPQSVPARRSSGRIFDI